MVSAFAGEFSVLFVVIFPPTAQRLRATPMFLRL